MFLEVDHIRKQYDSQQVLSEVSFSLPQHTTMSVLGKSGCGKSTLLKIIAGIEKANSGRLVLNNQDITNTKPSARNIVYLFQEALLFPHLSVFENIAFGLRIRKAKEGEIKKSVEEMARNLELESHLYKRPHQLSGGQKQRVAFGRALIIQPPLILLDEPFSNLDTEIRTAMQDLYKRVAKQFGITALFVTHDLKEALTMGDVMAYMQDGVLQVYSTKEEFVQDEKTGVKKEIGFWNDLKQIERQMPVQ